MAKDKDNLLKKLMDSTKKISHIQESWEMDADARLRFEWQWLDNLNMIAGNQWAAYEPRTGSWYEEPPPSADFPMVTANLLADDRDILLSRMLADWPIPHARAFGKRDLTGNSLTLAERWTSFFEYKYDQLRDQELLKELANHIVVLGGAFRHPDWDSYAGTDLVKQDVEGNIPETRERSYCRSCEVAYDTRDAEDTTRCPYCGKGGETVMAIPSIETEVWGKTGESKWVPQGDVSLELWPMWEVVPQAGAPNPRRCARLWRNRFLPTNAVKAMAQSKEQVVEDDNIDASENWDLKVQEITGSSGGFSRRADKVREMQGVVRLREYWEKPGADPEFPNGLHVRFAGSQDLRPIYATPYPYPLKSPLYKDFGLVFDRWDTVPGRFWPISHVEKMESYQRKLNVSISQVVYDQKLYGRRKYVLDKRMNISTDQLLGSGLSINTSRTDANVRDPFLLDFGGARSDSFHQVTTDLQIYERVSGIPNVLRGESIKNTRTATGHDMHREQAEAPILMKISPIYHGEIKLAKEIMRLVKDRYVPERDIATAYVGMHLTGGFKAEELGVKDADERFQGEVAVSVDLDAVWSLTMSDRLARYDRAIDKFGQLFDWGNPAVADWLMNVYRVPADILQPSIQVQKDRQEREIRRVLASMPIFVSQADHDEIHMSILGDFLVSDEGERLQEEAPDKYKVLEGHHQEHWQRYWETYYKKAAMEQQQQPQNGGQETAGGVPPTEQAQTQPGAVAV